jgi:hypothetical protein
VGAIPMGEMELELRQEANPETPVAPEIAAALSALATRASTPSLAFPKRRCTISTSTTMATPPAAEFLAAFLSSQPGAEALSGPEQAADADYRYVVWNSAPEWIPS